MSEHYGIFGYLATLAIGGSITCVVVSLVTHLVDVARRARGGHFTQPGKRPHWHPYDRR